MKEGDGDRVRKSVQDNFVDHVTPRANRVPAHTQDSYPDTFPNRGPVRRSHLPARSDESPVCWSGCVGRRGRVTKLLGCQASYNFHIRYPA